MIAAAIFDLDGTLIDTGRGIVRMMTDTLHNMGVEPADEKTIRSMIGLPLEVGLARFLGLPIDHPHVAVAVTKYKRRFHEWMVPQAADLLFPGVAEGLADLRERGLKLGIATSKHKHSAEVILQSAGIYPLLDVIAGSDSVTAPKPNPEMAWFVAAALQCRAHQCALIGDTHHDLAMGRAAQMTTIAVTYGIGSRDELEAEQPDAVVDSFSAVVSALKHHAGSSASMPASLTRETLG